MHSDYNHNIVNPVLFSLINSYTIYIYIQFHTQMYVNHFAIELANIKIRNGKKIIWMFMFWEVINLWNIKWKFIRNPASLTWAGYICNLDYDILKTSIRIDWHKHLSLFNKLYIHVFIFLPMKVPLKVVYHCFSFKTLD